LGTTIPAVAGIGRNLKRLREARGISQTAIARAAETTEPTVNRWERNQKIDPKVSTVLRLALALDCSVEDLVVELNEDYDQWRKTHPVTGGPQIDGALALEVTPAMLPSEPHRRLAFLLGYYKPEDLSLIVEEAKDILDRAIEERRGRGREPRSPEGD